LGRLLKYNPPLIRPTRGQPENTKAIARKPMTVVEIKQEGRPNLKIDLRDPLWAAFLAWLWPGAGHLYQRRYAKGFLFMACILGTFIFGMGLGRGRVVYASTRPNDFRWQYFMQLGVGLPALPALAQSYKTKSGADPWFPIAYRYPRGYIDGQGNIRSLEIIDDVTEFRRQADRKPIVDGLYAPPAGPIHEQENDVLGMWHLESKQLYDIGTLFAIVAGLLNLLVIYDAFAGPSIPAPQTKIKSNKAAAPQPAS
jgi:hypothetical protein